MGASVAIAACQDWHNNSDMIYDMDAQGYIGKRIIDLSFGEYGGFWHWMDTNQRQRLTTSDGNPTFDTDMHLDVMAPMPIDLRGQYNTAAWDGPYRFTGTADRGEFDHRYGLAGGSMTPDERMHLLITGTTYALDLVKVGGTALVKCQNQVVSGGKRWQTREISDAAEAHGAVLMDEAIMKRPVRGQPPDRDIKHLRSNTSSLLIFRKVSTSWPTLL